MRDNLIYPTCSREQPIVLMTVETTQKPAAD